jgi:hypothetical protein
MIRRALLAAVLSMSAFGQAGAAPPLFVWIDPDGTAYLHNTTDAPISFDGYQIAAESNVLDVAGWNSIGDQVAADPQAVLAALGAGALAFGEANPSAVNLAELNISGSATLPGQGKFAIGKPFGVGGYDVQFFYKILGNPNSTPGDNILHVPRIPFPEPATWLLATLAALGYVAVRRRR